MNEAQVRTVEQMREVLSGVQALEFRPSGEDAQRYGWIGAVLKRVSYRQLERAERGVVRAYLQHFSGYSRAQLTRLVSRWVRYKSLVKQYRAPAHAFARRYNAADVALLAQVDAAMDTLSGPATACVLRRQREVFGDTRFERLGSISPAHVYNLRHSHAYRTRRVVHTKTQPRHTPSIGLRKAPVPAARPGFIRIDSVHQGDLDGTKGLYHINAVDCITQWEITASLATICETHLVPVIEQMIEQFPFRILGFHADNGSEYVNHRVAQMLNKLRIEFTRSRPRHSNDNGLAETKNGAIVRKVFGYAHIPQRHAHAFNRFCIEVLNPFLNYHRPCLFATEVADPKKPGRIQRKYHPKHVMTPLDKLLSLPNAAACLREGISPETLTQRACQLTDLQAAEQLQHARCKLFASLQRRRA